MNEAERQTEVQAALADMREDIRTHAPNHPTDPAVYLIQALKRRGLRVVTDDEWEDQFEQGEESGRQEMVMTPPGDEQRVFDALVPRFP